MKLIVGLGNPGKKYESTRHNIGFMAIDEIANRFQIKLNKEKHKGLFGKGVVNNQEVILLKPMTYMNLSGESVRPLIKENNISLKHVAVIYDDLDLPLGKIRYRKKGSAGGHNGIKSLIAHLETQEFNRIRMGIDRPIDGRPIVDYVLGKFNHEEKEVVSEMTKTVADSCEMWMSSLFVDVMNKFNQ